MVDSSTQTEETMSDPIPRDRYDSAIKKIEARQALRTEILELIRPHRLSHEEPPFDIGDMIVFALTLSAKEKLSEREIHRWIIKAFPYFNLQAIDYYLQSVEQIDEDECETPEKEIIEGIHGALRHFDLALEESFDTAAFERRYSIKTGAARIYLAYWLEPERKGTFQFLKLAPELRNRIYEMIFVYPCPGICFNSNTRGPVLFSRSDKPDLLIKVPDWDDPDCEDIRWISPERPSDTLAILQTCKQIRDEAAPMFYGMNDFFFGGSDSYMGLMIRQLPLARARFLKNIHIQLNYPDRDGKRLEDSFNSLATLSLDKLTLWMSKNTEYHWLDAFQNLGMGMWTRNKYYKRRLWIMIGAVMKVKKLELRGDCPAFKAFMSSKVEMEDPDHKGVSRDP